MAKKEEKARIIAELADKLQRASIAVVTDYRGMTVGEMAALRNRLRQVGAEYKVTKNTLARFAAERVGRRALTEVLEGPTAIAFGYQELSDTAKALQDFLRTSRVLKVKTVLVGDRRLPPEELGRIAELPPRSELVARIVGTVQGPLAGVVGMVSAPLSTLVGLIEARRRQLEEGAAA